MVSANLVSCWYSSIILKKGSQNPYLQNIIKSRFRSLRAPCINFELIILLLSSPSSQSSLLPAASKFWPDLGFYSEYWLIPHPNDFLQTPRLYSSPDTYEYVLSFMTFKDSLLTILVYITVFLLSFLFVSVDENLFFYSATNVLTGLQ